MSFDSDVFLNETHSEAAINEALRKEYLAKYKKARFNLSFEAMTTIRFLCGIFSFGLIFLMGWFVFLAWMVGNDLSSSAAVTSLKFLVGLISLFFISFVYLLFAKNSFSVFGVSFFSKSPENINRLFNLFKIFNKKDYGSKKDLMTFSTNIQKPTLLFAFFQILKMEREFYDSEDKEAEALRVKMADEKAKKFLNESATAFSEENKNVRREMLEAALKNMK